MYITNIVQSTQAVKVYYVLSYDNVFSVQKIHPNKSDSLFIQNSLFSSIISLLVYHY